MPLETKICNGGPEHFYVHSGVASLNSQVWSWPLKKAELIARIRHRAGSRYGQPFSAAMFNDLMKDGLIPERGPGWQCWQAPRLSIRMSILSPSVANCASKA